MTGNILYKEKKIHFRDKGRGPAIVFLHGFLENMHMWDHFVDRLSVKYRVITIDLPGSGRSECIGEVHLMEDMAIVVNDVLKNREVNKCLMIGHSMGGYVALAFADQFPAKLKGFGLLHSHARGDSQEARKNRDRAIRVVRSDRSAFIFNFFPELFAPDNVPRFEKEIKALHADAMETSPDAIAAALEGMKRRTDKLDVLNESKVPVLFVLGKKDKRIPLEDTMKQAALPADSEILILDNVGHMGHIEARSEILKAIEGFAHLVF